MDDFLLIVGNWVFSKKHKFGLSISLVDYGQWAGDPALGLFPPPPPPKNGK